MPSLSDYKRWGPRARAGRAAAAGGGAFAGQFRETWSTNSIRSTLWAASVTGTGSASAATGALVLTISAGGSATVANPGSSANRYSLTAAGASGVVVDVSSITLGGGRCFFALTDSAGRGWTFHFDPAADSLYFEAVAAGSGPIEASRISTSYGGLTSFSTASARYWRLMKSGTDVVAHYSPNKTSWSAVGIAAPIGAETITALGIVLEVYATASAVTATIGNAEFN